MVKATSKNKSVYDDSDQVRCNWLLFGEEHAPAMKPECPLTFSF